MKETPEELIKTLEENSDLDLVTITLKVFSERPINDQRFVPLIKTFLSDKRFALFGVPPYYGEVRWQAAAALSALNKVLGITEEIVLDDAIAPIFLTKISELWVNSKLNLTKEEERLLQTDRYFYTYIKLEKLRSAGYLKTFRRVF